MWTDRLLFSTELQTIYPNRYPQTIIVKILNNIYEFVLNALPKMNLWKESTEDRKLSDSRKAGM
jgi:hypothetical protein